MCRIAALGLMLSVTFVLAGDGNKGKWWDVFCPGRLKLPLGCPDDYCCKTKPPLPLPYCPCGHDDYCGKKPPALPPEFRPCGCDDYCPKPPINLPPDAPGKCYPTDGCCPPPPCHWLRFPWWGKRLCGPVK